MDQLIQRFYSAFARGDWQTMASCYHPDSTFTDEVFVGLKGNEVMAMWRMLLERSKGDLEISFSHVQVSSRQPPILRHAQEEAGDSPQTGSADWVAVYIFSATGRRVINRIHASFEFNDGKIIRHTDQFNFHHWAGQAMGWKGKLLGGFPFFRKKVQTMAMRNLASYLKSPQ